MCSLLEPLVQLNESHDGTGFFCGGFPAQESWRSPTSRSSCLGSKVPGEPAAFQWGTAIEELPKAFPFGGPNARKTVQWTVFSEVGPAGPWNGGFRRNCLQFCRKTDEVGCCIRLLFHSHRLFCLLRPMTGRDFCGGFPAQESWRSPTSRSSCLDSKVPGEPAAFQWGTAIEELPKAFP